MKEYELGFEFHTSFKHEFRPGDSKEILYKAEVYNLRVEDLYQVLGAASLKKLRLVDVPQIPVKSSVWRVLLARNPRPEPEKTTPEKKWVVEWAIRTEFSCNRILCEGKAVPVEKSWGFRSSLVAEALKTGVIITNHLLDAAFNDIEDKVTHDLKVLRDNVTS